MEGAISYANPWAWYRWVQPHPLLASPWRPEGIKPLDSDQLRKEIMSIKYDNANVAAIVLGPCGSGKSSFINSLLSCMKKRISKKTPASSSAGTFTDKLQYVTTKKLNITLYDTIGYNRMRGITNTELREIIDGKLKHGYKFKKAYTKNSNELEECTICQPEEENPVQISVIVLDANVAKKLPTESNKDSEPVHIQKIKGAIEVLTEKETSILQVFILTKVDVICAEVRGDPKMIFRSRVVKEVVDKVHTTFGVDRNDIFPVVNYVEETETNEERDIPLLLALRHIVHLAADRTERV